MQEKKDQPGGSDTLPPRPGEHPPSERRADIGLPKDQPVKPPPKQEPEPIPKM